MQRWGACCAHLFDSVDIKLKQAFRLPPYQFLSDLAAEGERDRSRRYDISAERDFESEFSLKDDDDDSDTYCVVEKPAVALERPVDDVERLLDIVDSPVDAFETAADAASTYGDVVVVEGLYQNWLKRKEAKKSEEKAQKTSKSKHNTVQQKRREHEGHLYKDIAETNKRLGSTTGRPLNGHNQRGNVPASKISILQDTSSNLRHLEACLNSETVDTNRVLANLQRKIAMEEDYWERRKLERLQRDFARHFGLP